MMTVRPVPAPEAITSRMNSSRATGSRLETGSSSTSSGARLASETWPLPAGQGLDLALERDAERIHPRLRQPLIPAGVHRPAQVEHVRDAEVDRKSVV